MDDEDEHPWPVSPITTHEEGTIPPLPFEELLLPPLPSSPQHPFLGELQVDEAGGVGAQANANAARHSVQASPYTTSSDDGDDSEEDVEEEAEGASIGEPPCKKPRQLGEDSPDVGTRRSRSTDSESSVSSSNSSANTSQYVASNDLDYNPNYFDTDAFDIDVSTMCENENMSGDERSAESGNSETEHDDQEELHDDDSNSMSNSQKEECVQENIQNKDDKMCDEDSDSVGSSQQELGEESNQDEDIEVEDIEVDDITEPVNDVLNQDINEDIYHPDDGIQDNIDGTNADDYYEDGYSDYDSDDIDALLEEGLPEDVRIPLRKRKVDDIGRQNSQVAFGESAQKEDLSEGIVKVIEKSHLKVGKQMPVDLLPSGWISIIHHCGMPLYLHRPSRVITWSRPYVLGSGSARRHKVPINSIPCLHYKKQKEKEAAENNPSSNVNQTQSNNQDCQPEDNLNAARGEQIDSETIENGRVGECQPGGEATQLQAVVQSLNSDSTADKEMEVNPGDSNQVPNGKTNLVNDNSAAAVDDFVSKHIYVCKDESIGSAAFREYLDRLFEFETHAVRKYRSWTHRRKYIRRAKKDFYQERPEFPNGPTLITCQIPEKLGSSSGKKEFVINALNKSPVCILHEYSQRVVKTIPTYVYTESGNANMPFEACVQICGVKYGRGQAKSKKFAKYEAARATLKLLIPDFHNMIKKSDRKEEPTNLEYFDHVAIDDLRVYELCERSGLLTPWQLLNEYQQRNYGMSNMQVKLDVQISKSQKSNYTMTYGPHVVKGICKNKKIGKQIGAQQLLVKLHPHLNNWGAIIKMYGRQGMSSMNLEKKELKQSIVELQGKAKNKPNERMLNKLKSEMRRLYMEKEKQETAATEISPLENVTTAS